MNASHLFFALGKLKKLNINSQVLGSTELEIKPEWPGQTALSNENELIRSYSSCANSDINTASKTK